MASDQEMRDWARANGYAVGERGRLPQHIIGAFRNACIICSAQKPAHKAWCEFYVSTSAEVKTVETVTEIPADYCDECYTNAPAHHESCSLYVAPAVVVPVADAVVPEPSAPAVVNPEPTDASLTALIRSIAATAVTAAPASLDVDQVRKIAEEVALEVVAEVATPKVVHVHVKDRETVVLEEKTHAEFENVLKLLGRKRNVYLYGPPGTGKSTIAQQAAKALGVPYGDISCEPTMAASKLFGFVDANGVCQSTLFKDIFTGGGVWNYEEIDNGHPGITAAMNTALANGHCAFPDGIGIKSPNFYAIATANTHGTGATRAFVGRNQLDAATLDRFVEWEIGIDEDVEEMGVLAEIADKVEGKKWLTQVRAWRKSVETLNVQMIISPRGAMNGAVMLDEGFSWEQAAKACIWKGCDASTRAKIERGA